MHLLRRAIRKELMTQLLLYGCLFLGGVFLTWYFFSSHTLLAIVGIFFSLLGLFYIIRLSQYWPTDRHPIMFLLFMHPEQVVWVYTVLSQRMPYGLALTQYGLLYLKLRNGEDLCLSVPTRHLRVVSHCLNRLLPHATFGYSPDKEQLYRINPEMLLR